MPRAATVVFVCEHGSVKSLIATSLLERAARERGIDVRAVSRGLEPDERVPPKIAAALLADGFDVAQFQPRALDETDVAGATRVIGIGVDLSGHEVPPSALRSWNDVPPASGDYAAARTSLERHIEALLDEL
jgi:arsenate reductase (thioredoxin)